MITKIILSPNDELTPAIMEWSYEKEMFIVNVPKGISLGELSDLVDELKRISEWAD